MDSTLKSSLEVIMTQYLARNYDYLWLRTMLEQAAATATANSTLILGSSYALNAVRENCWHNAFNCSMHSQDIYYDFQCAKRVLNDAERGRFSRCIIFIGYYIAYQDLSLSKISRDRSIANIYYPIFKDAHHWDAVPHKDLWDWLNIELPPESSLTPEWIKETCEQSAVRILLEYGTYYSAIRPRRADFDWNGRTWGQLSPEERIEVGKFQAERNNQLFQHKETPVENKKIMQELIHFLYSKGVQPIVVIAPFSPEYVQFSLPEMRAGLVELLESVPEDIEFVDFNQINGIFKPADFMDSHHLSETGAEKVSTLLAETFGK